MSLSVIASLQSGVVTRIQALETGMSTGAIRHALDSGRWRRLYSGVYATFSGTVSRDAWLWAALLYAGQGAVLSHETAAELQHLTDRRASEIHLSVPSSRRVVRAPGIRIHVSSVLASAERYQRVSGLGFLPRTWPEDTVLDLIGQCTCIDDVCGWIARAVSRNQISEARMRKFMSERARLRWRQDVGILLTEAIEGTHSPLEYRWDRDVERAHGLPRSTPQRPYVKPAGGRGFRDRAFIPFGVIVELDGDLTHPGETRWADRERDNDAARNRQQTLRFGWKHVRHPASCQTAALTADVLRNRGWSAQPGPCSATCVIGKG